MLYCPQTSGLPNLLRSLGQGGTPSARNSSRVFQGARASTIPLDRVTSPPALVVPMVLLPCPSFVDELLVLFPCFPTRGGLSLNDQTVPDRTVPTSTTQRGLSL